MDEQKDQQPTMNHQEGIEALIQALQAFAESVQQALDKLQKCQAVDERNREFIESLTHRPHLPCRLIPVYKDVHHKGETFNLTNRKNGRR